MQKTFSSLKNKILKRCTLNDENLKDYKSTNINILLNRVRVNKKKEFFNITVQQAISVIERIGEPYKMQENESNT